MRWLKAVLMGVLGLASVAPGLVAAAPLGLPATPQIIDNMTWFDVNNIEMVVTNHGSFGYDLETGNAGARFPKGQETKTVIFASGLWIGARVGDDLRVTVGEYSQEFAAGTIQADGSPASEAGSGFQTYKVDRGAETSEDYLNWPFEDGAPADTLDADYDPDDPETWKPLILGDQTLWCVYNDAVPAKHNNNAGGRAPLGIEVRQTVFGFDRLPPLGNMIFVKFEFENKGGNLLEDAYVSVWCDPDLGGFTDDLVGCDPDLGLGYCYNATNEDELYGNKPPAVGYDFFKGPTNTNGIEWPPGSGKFPESLPMTSFNKYINGTDPDSYIEAYNYQKGLTAEGAPLHEFDDPEGPVTTFSVSGDPVTGTGWLDDNPADRRFMLTAGPFQMMPGAVEEVVVGIMVAQGSDRLSSISLLKEYDERAQAVFDLDFNLPPPPPRPTLYARPYDRAIELIWGTEADGDVQINEALGEEYHHQGFNVYQGESFSGPWKKLVTYDVEDSIALIYNEIFNVDQGGIQTVIVQNAPNEGLTHHLRIDQDAIRGGGLVNFDSYYFSVTAFSYDVLHTTPLFIGPNQVGHLAPVLENSPAAVEVMPRSSAGVLEVQATHAEGLSDGSVEVAYVDQSAITGHDYEVTFRANPDSASAGDFPIVWDLTDVTDARAVIEAETFQGADFQIEPVDGMALRVSGPASGFKINAKGEPMIDEVLAGGSPVPPDVNGGPGNDVWHSLNSTSEWVMSAGAGDGGVGPFTRDGADLANLSAADIEMRWDNDPNNWGWWFFEDSGEEGFVSQIPFGLYLVDPNSGAETRLITIMHSGGGTPGVYDFAEGIVDAAFGLPATDWCYAYDGNYDAYAVDAADGVINSPNDHGNNELFARMVIGAYVDPPVMPSTGTVIKFSTTKPNTPSDVFRFKTFRPGESVGTVIDNDLDRIRAVPNPYLNQSAYELDQFDRVIRFVNLPASKATIRIFNLAGELVRTLVKEDPETSWFRWDLQNESDIPVASGIYIYHVDAQGVGTKVGKLAVFVEKERLNRF